MENKKAPHATVTPSTKKALSKPKSVGDSSEEKCKNEFGANNLGEEAADAMIAVVSEAVSKEAAISSNEKTKEKPKFNDIGEVASQIS
jgi:dihydroorotate dehydrogenase